MRKLDGLTLGKHLRTVSRAEGSHSCDGSLLLQGGMANSTLRLLSVWSTAGPQGRPTALTDWKTGPAGAKRSNVDLMI